MRVWGYNAAAAVVLYAVIAPMLLVPTVAFVYRRYGRLATLPFLAAAGGAFYALVLVAVAVLPLPADQAAACARVNTGWHLEPFRAFAEAAESAGEMGVASFLVSWTFLQLVMNVVLLVPVGILIGWHSRRSVWVAAGVGLLISLAIETTQGTGIWGIYDCPYRYAEFDDLLTNTAGAAIGWTLGRTIARRIPWPLRVGGAEPTGTPAGAPAQPANGWTAPPRVARRVLAVALDAVGYLLTSLLVQIAALAGAVAIGWFQAGDELDPVAVAIAGTVVPLMIVLVIVPWVRIDRATPGQAAVLLAPVTVDGSRPPLARAVLRSAIRWWSMIAFVLVPSAVTALLLAVWIVAEIATVAIRPDRRSLPDLGSGLHLAARAPTPRWWHRRPTTADDPDTTNQA